MGNSPIFSKIYEIGTFFIIITYTQANRDQSRGVPDKK
jgi:hypothetical protein